MHDMLQRSGGTPYTKWRANEMMKSVMRSETSLLLVRFVYFDLPIAATSVQGKE